MTTILLSGAVLPEHHLRLRFQTRESQIQINEVPRDSNSHRGPAEALERPYDLLPKAAFSRRGAGWAAPARGRVPWGGRAPRRLPHSCPLPERRFAPEPAPPSTPELARALPPAGPAARG